MVYKYLMTVLTVLGACTCEERGVRQARNPALLHLGHAGQPVGDYTGAVAARGVTPGGHGGPHIVILGGQPAHVSTHVAGKDSLEELDQDLQQHYGRLQGSGVRYVPNSSNQGHYLGQGRQTGYTGSSAGLYGGANEVRPRTPIAYTLGQGVPGVNFGYAPLVYSPGPTQPTHGYSHSGVSTFVGHPLQTHQVSGGQGPSHYSSQGVTPSPLNYGPASFYSSQGVTSAPVNYAPHYATATPAPVNYSPSSYPTTPSPVTHTVASPVIAQPARVPAPVGAAGFHSLRYPQGPIFVPIQALSHQPQYQGLSLGRSPSYSPSLPEGARTSPQVNEYRSGEEERPRYYVDTQERRPEYSSSERGFGDIPEFDKYSDESLAKAAGSPAYQSTYPDDKTSFEDSSSEVSGERPSGNSGAFKYSFGDDHRTEGRSYGDGKVATSYQSVTFETNSQPRYHGHSPKHQ